MTRAEERLIIAGYQGARTPSGDCWYNMVRRSLEPRAEEVVDPVFPEKTVLRRGRPRATTGEAATPQSPPAGELPAWLRTAPPAELGGMLRIRPSRAVDPAPGRMQAAEAALNRGRLLHALLQHLPEVRPDTRAAAGERFLAAQEPGLPLDERGALLAEAGGVLDHPGCALLFAPGSAAEAEISATVMLADGRPVEVSGRIDRLAVASAEILFCDFKTGAPPASLEATPRSYVTQAALYRAALAALYRDRPVRAFLIWTEGPEVHELPPAMLAEALVASPPVLESL
jgi:ATP-dependent helicase/nuclease subunit A